MGRNDTFGLYLYTSDDGTQYAVKLSAAVAAEGSYGSELASLGSYPVWPFHNKSMRHCYGKNGAQRDKLPVATAGYVSTIQSGGFTLGGVAYAFTGYSGEKRKGSNI